MLIVHLFVCFIPVRFSHFSLPLGVGGWLLFVTVAFEIIIYILTGTHTAVPIACYCFYTVSMA